VPKLWHKHLLKALKEDGFVMSKFDPCLLFKKDMMLVARITNVISAKQKQDGDKMVEQLRKKEPELTHEGSFSEFLGIELEGTPSL